MDMNTDEDDPPIVFRPRRLQAYGGRGRIYSWLRAYRKEVATGLATRKLTWRLICEELEKHEVFSRTGRKPTRAMVFKTWKVLLRDLAAIGETPLHKPEKPKPPSRMPDWTPPAFQQPAQGQAGASPVPRATPAANKEPYDAVKRAWEIQCIMAERSGKPPPPPPPHLLLPPQDKEK
jgi:hypothetical protein